jgi:hypothetical protein
MDEARREGSPFGWKRFRQPFLDALTAGTAEPFCVGWLEHLVEARWGSLEEPFQPDPALADTIDSLALLLDWWLPMRVAGSAEKAARKLKEEIDYSLFFHHLEYNFLAEEASELGARNEYEKRSERIDELREDAHFVARVAAHLVGYDPSGSDASPSKALREAVRAELAIWVGPFPAPWEPNRKSLGVELGRLFALPENAPDRLKLEQCVAKLGDEQREFIETMYRPGPPPTEVGRDEPRSPQASEFTESGLKVTGRAAVGGGSKMLEPGRWGGTRRIRVGNAAKTSLLACMPELARFAMPDLARFAAAMPVEED